MNKRLLGAHAELAERIEHSGADLTERVIAARTFMDELDRLLTMDEETYRAEAALRRLAMELPVTNDEDDSDDESNRATYP